MRLLLPLVALSFLSVPVVHAADPAIYYRIPGSADPLVDTGMIDGFAFAPKSASLFGEMVVSDPVEFQKTPGGTRISVSGGEVRFCADAACASPTSDWSVIDSPVLVGARYVQARVRASYAAGSPSIATVVGNGVPRSFSVGSPSGVAASLPSFPDATATAGASFVDSAFSTVSGYAPLAAVADDTGLSYQVCGSSGTCTDWRRHGSTIAQGDQIRLRYDGPLVAGSSVLPTLRLGPLATTWRVSVPAPSTPVPSFGAFAAVDAAKAGSILESEVVRISGYGRSVLVVFSGPYADTAWRTCDSSGTCSGWKAYDDYVLDGYGVQLRTRSSWTPSAVLEPSLTPTGGPKRTWRVATSAQPPSVGAYVDLVDQVPGSYVYSGRAVVSGFRSAFVSGPSGGFEMQICSAAGVCEAWTKSNGYAQDGGTIQLRTMPWPYSNQTVSTSFYVESIQRTWSVTTRNTNPSVGAFPSVTGAATGTRFVSEPVEVRNIQSANLMLTGDAGAEVQVCAGATCQPWSTVGQVKDGDTLKLRLTTAATSGTTSRATLYVMGTGVYEAREWAVTTRN